MGAQAWLGWHRGKRQHWVAPPAATRPRVAPASSHQHDIPFTSAEQEGCPLDAFIAEQTGCSKVVGCGDRWEVAGVGFAATAKLPQVTWGVSGALLYTPASFSLLTRKPSGPPVRCRRSFGYLCVQEIAGRVSSSPLTQYGLFPEKVLCKMNQQIAHGRGSYTCGAACLKVWYRL